jgi:hypothetical protein
MTEEYWLDYFEKQKDDPMKKNVVGITILEMQEEAKSRIHHLEHYSMCKSENPFIRQMRRSPNITIGTVAELICRTVACDLQLCMSMMKVAAHNPRRNLQ